MNGYFKILVVFALSFLYMNCAKMNNAISAQEKDSFNNTGSTSLALQNPVQAYGWLQVSGRYIKSTNTGNPVALRGMSFGWHNWWPRFYNAGAVSELKKNFNVTVLRAAMGINPDPDEWSKKGYLNYPETAKAIITKVVDACIKEGIYVIIDWHCHDIIVTNTITGEKAVDLTPKAVAFFKEMAQKYKNTPNVIFEIFNEPRGYDVSTAPPRVTWPQIKTYAIEVINAIRAQGANNLILVGTPNWGSDIVSVQNDPLKNVTNVAYTVHFYSNSGSSTPNSPEVLSYQQAYRNRVKSALNAGIPVYVSECAAMQSDGDGPLNYDTWYGWVEFMNNNYLSWNAWSIADKNETCSMFYKSASDSGPWADNVIKDWGLIVRKYLKGEVITFK